jgi:hypothetical protein
MDERIIIIPPKTVNMKTPQTEPAPRKLLDQVSEAIRIKHRAASCLIF